MVQSRKLMGPPTPVVPDLQSSHSFVWDAANHHGSSCHMVGEVADYKMAELRHSWEIQSLPAAHAFLAMFT